MKTAEMTSLRVAEDITELVGETPILHLRKIVPPNVADVYAKLEYLNPGGSIKDRAALGMVLKAEQAGLLKPGATIFEATAGNTCLLYTSWVVGSNACTVQDDTSRTRYFDS